MTSRIFNKHRQGKAAYTTGLLAELCAVYFLMIKGYRIEKRRYRTPFGEIDILASKNETLVVVEVKKRKTLALARESLHTSQQRRLKRAGLFAHKKYPWCGKMRFDGIFFAPWTWPEHFKSILCDNEHG